MGLEFVMATYKRCDRCKRNTEETRLLIRSVRLVVYDFVGENKAYRDIQQDLCNECLDDVMTAFCLTPSQILDDLEEDVT